MRVVVRRRFTFYDYNLMGEAGILHGVYRVELIEGKIVEMAATGTRHFACSNQLNRLLVRSVGDVAIVSVQNPARLDEHIEPQPDLTTVLRLRDYRESLPLPEDVLHLSEVSDITLAYALGRGVKLPLYARAGIREVWIVDFPGEVIERHTDQYVDGFRTLERLRRGKEIKSAALPELAFRVETVLGSDGFLSCSVHRTNQDG